MTSGKSNRKAGRDQPLGIADGRVVPLNEMSVPVWDHGLRFGLGVFETVKVFEGTALLLHRHAERMADGWNRLNPDEGAAQGHEPSRLAEWGARAVKLSGVRDGSLRMIATFGTTGSDGRVFAWAVEESTWPERVHETGIRATLTEAPRRPGAPISGLKSLAWADFYLARERARRDGFDEALLRDAQGHLVEGTATSLFAIEGRSLRTPPLETGILPGITREFVLSRAAAMGLDPREEPLDLSDLERSGEAFLTSSMLGAAGLVAVDGLTVGGGKPGPVARLLNSQYLGLARRDGSTAEGL